MKTLSSSAMLSIICEAYQGDPEGLGSDLMIYAEQGYSLLQIVEELLDAVEEDTAAWRCRQGSTPCPGITTECNSSVDTNNASNYDVFVAERNTNVSLRIAPTARGYVMSPSRAKGMDVTPVSWSGRTSTKKSSVAPFFYNRVLSTCWHHQLICYDVITRPISRAEHSWHWCKTHGLNPEPWQLNIM